MQVPNVNMLLPGLKYGKRWTVVPKRPNSPKIAFELMWRPHGYSVLTHVNTGSGARRK
jgi:hypothetical protein